MIIRSCLRQLPKRPSIPSASSKASQTTTHPSPNTPRLLSTLHSPHRPQFLPSTTPTLPPVGVSCTTPTSASTLDLLPKISSSPMLAGIQVRCGPRDTYNMTHFRRKRKHGFLARVRTRKGRALLARRRARGRKNLSH